MLPVFIKNNPFLLKAFRFCVVGGTAFILSILVFNLLKETIAFFAQYVGIASILGDICGLIYGFYINKHWTYSTQKRDGERYFFRYMSLYSTTILLNWLCFKGFLWLINANVTNFTAMQDMYENVSKILATGISTIANFIGTNYIVFREEKEAEFPA